MTIQKYYIGSLGPFLYNDTDSIDDVDGDFTGETQQAFRTDGPIATDYTPSADEDVLRLEDLFSLVRRYTALSSQTGSGQFPKTSTSKTNDNFRYHFMMSGS